MNPAEYQQASTAYLRQSIAVLREEITSRLGEAKSSEGNSASLQTARRELEETRQQWPEPLALDRISAAFELTTFERDVLLLCAGMELERELVVLLGNTHITGALAATILDKPDAAALSPWGALRRNYLVHMLASGETTGALVIRERILWALQGLNGLDPMFDAFLSQQAGPEVLAGSHRAVATDIVNTWSQAELSGWPKVVLLGETREQKRSIAASAAQSLGLTLYVLSANDVPADAYDREKLQRLWECETKLSPCALYVDGEDGDTPQAFRHALSFAQNVQGPVFVAGQVPTLWHRRGVVFFDVPRLGFSEQRQMWNATFGSVAEALSAQIDVMVGSFRMEMGSIQNVGALAQRHFEASGVVGLEARIWEQCRRQARPRLNDLADRIETKACWNDLVLAQDELGTLQSIVAQAQQRLCVYERWGFGEKINRGLGLSVLFAGTSGTGKTMAAEILASELRLDLYRVDLSRVVSKYIGETEKNLARIFDAADEGGVVLLFDEADALFGKRSEVHDSHDRHANIEVSYLLQRMEAYQGVAILTTNMKNALDTAFLRRLRYVVTFAFPGVAERAEIWRRVFPRQTPTEGLDVDKLARLPVTGGNIRNIALNAAFLAAHAGEPVRMSHLRRAAQAECTKLDKEVLLPELESWT